MKTELRKGLSEDTLVGIGCEAMELAVKLREQTGDVDRDVLCVALTILLRELTEKLGKEALTIAVCICSMVRDAMGEGKVET